MSDVKMQNDTVQFLNDVLTEVAAARHKFPRPDAAVVALTEEVGELARATLQESLADVYAEAVQVACCRRRRPHA